MPTKPDWSSLRQIYTVVKKQPERLHHQPGCNRKMVVMTNDGGVTMECKECGAIDVDPSRAL